jgi:hypothetical protein
MNAPVTISIGPPVNGDLYAGAMKHEGRMFGREWLPRAMRWGIRRDVLVRWASGEVEAEIVDLSRNGFRLRSSTPLPAGCEVTLQADQQQPIRALVRWANGENAGGVFVSPAAL